MPASRPESAKAPRITESDLTPISRAVSKSAAAARRASPNMVRCNSSVVATSVTIVTRMTTVSNVSIRSEPSAHVLLLVQAGRLKFLTDADT